MRLGLLAVSEIEMGWKLALVALPATSNQDALANSVAGNPRQASQVRTVEEVHRGGDLAIAQFPTATVIFDNSSALAAFELDPAPFLARLREARADTAWVLYLQSTSNAYGWARFEGGTRVRFCFGSADGQRNDGARLPTEDEVLERLALRPFDGETYLDAKGNSRSHDSVGEDIVLGLIEAILDVAPDDDAFLEARATIYTAAGRLGPVGGAQLITEAARLLGWSVARTQSTWQTMVEALRTAVLKGPTELPGVLLLRVLRRPDKEGRDPRTGASIVISGSARCSGQALKEWTLRDLDAPPPPVSNGNDFDRCLEALAAAAHGCFYLGAPSVAWPDLGVLTVARIPAKSAQHPTSGVVMHLPPSNRWAFEPDQRFLEP